MQVGASKAIIQGTFEVRDKEGVLKSTGVLKSEEMSEDQAKKLLSIQGATSLKDSSDVSNTPSSD